jgi:hypothetical protein
MDKRDRDMPVRRRTDCGNTMFKDNTESTSNERSITNTCFLECAETRNLTDRLFSMEVSMDPQQLVYRFMKYGSICTALSCVFLFCVGSNCLCAIVILGES